MLCVIGVSPLEYLRTRDNFERDALIEIGNRAFELRKKMNENLAVLIGNNVVKALGGK